MYNSSVVSKPVQKIHNSYMSEIYNTKLILGKKKIICNNQFGNHNNNLFVFIAKLFKFLEGILFFQINEFDFQHQR